MVGCGHILTSGSHDVHYNGHFKTPPPLPNFVLSIHPNATPIQHRVQKIYMFDRFFHTLCSKGLNLENDWCHLFI